MPHRAGLVLSRWIAPVTARRKIRVCDSWSFGAPVLGLGPSESGKVRARSYAKINAWDVESDEDGYLLQNLNRRFFECFPTTLRKFLKKENEPKLPVQKV